MGMGNFTMLTRYEQRGEEESKHVDGSEIDAKIVGQFTANQRLQVQR